MRIQRLASAAIAAALVASPTVASAKLLVAPTILGQGLEPARDIIDEALRTKLLDGRVARLPGNGFVNVKLKQCKNSMSCLSRVGAPAGASHLIHVILARRGSKVLSQFTLLDARTNEEVDRVRATSGLGLTFIEDAVNTAMDRLVASIKKLPEWKDGGLLRISEAELAASGVRPGVGGPAQSNAPKRVTMSSTPAPKPVEADPVLVAETPPEFGPNYLAYCVGGVGLVAILTGGVAWLLGSSDISDANNTSQLDGAKRARLQTSGNQKQTAGAALMLGGGAAVGLGTMFYVTGWGAAKYPTDPARTQPGGEVGLVMSF